MSPISSTLNRLAFALLSWPSTLKPWALCALSAALVVVGLTLIYLGTAPPPAWNLDQLACAETTAEREARRKREDRDDQQRYDTHVKLRDEARRREDRNDPPTDTPKEKEQAPKKGGK